MPLSGHFMDIEGRVLVYREISTQSNFMVTRAVPSTDFHTALPSTKFV